MLELVPEKWKTGFSEKGMRVLKNLEHTPIQPNRAVL
jgi:hypothetical protein